MEVAVKTSVTPRGCDKGALRVKLLQEAVTMAQFEHPNVVSFLGAVINRDNVSYIQWLVVTINTVSWCR